MKKEQRRRSSSDSSHGRDLKQIKRDRPSLSTSPPRRPVKRENSSDISPPRQTLPVKIERRSPSSDASPPRRARKNSSPATKSRRSPPRRIKRESSSDVSPPRRKRYSPEKNKSRHHYSSSPRRSRWSPSPGPSRKRTRSPEQSQKMKKTLDGKLSGLQDAKTLKRENDLYKEKQDKMYRELNPEVSGRNADIVIRDRSRKGRDFAREMEEERIKTEKELERKKVYDRWGKGLKQIEDTENRVKEMMHEMSKPLARTADDEDLQGYLKDQERIDDPMLQYMRNKKKEADKKKGIQEKPTYQGAFPENRYGIEPGYRWDGVDRSNGYEKKYFDMISSKKAVEEEAYRYATEDM